MSSKCTHYGAPLITGAYKDGKIRCPWHGACFSAVTGDIEDYPGLDSLQSYDVSKKNTENSAEVTSLYFELPCQFLKRKWLIIVITHSLLGILHCNLYPQLHLRHKFHSWSINEKLQAINIDNALQNCMVVLTGKNDIFYFIGVKRSSKNVLIL